jgi:hypothetical protein
MSAYLKYISDGRTKFMGFATAYSEEDKFVGSSWSDIGYRCEYMDGEGTGNIFSCGSDVIEYIQ